MKEESGMTLDRLAGIIKRELDETNRKMDQGFKAVDERFDKMDERFERIEDKLETLKAEVEHRRVHVFDHKDLEHRVEKLEEKVFPRRLAKHA